MIRRNVFSILVALIITYLSLSESETYDKISWLNFPGADKVVHFGIYFVFMSVILFENRKITGKITTLFIAGLVPFIYGGLMEVLQMLVTETRTGSVTDMLSNLAGILSAVIIFILFRPFKNQVLK